MKRLGNIHIRLPLFIRVVALYVVIGVPAWFGWTSLQPADTTIHASAVTKPTPTVTAQKSNRISGVPTRIQVPRLGIDLTVIDGEYDRAQDTWTLTDDKAQFARMTDLPNDESGNTFIYGHNTDAVFAKLSGLQVGDSALITTTNGHTFEYTFNGNQIVQPDNTSILASTPKPQLTLMTCEGILSQTRRVMFFDFKGVA